LKRISIDGIIVIFFILFLFIPTLTTSKAEIELEPKNSTIVIDRLNKLNIKGDVYIAYSWGEQLSFPYRFINGLIHIKDTMIKWTQIDTRFDKHLLLSSERLLKMPFVFVTTEDKFELTETEKKNVKKYFKNGGFMVLDNPNPRDDFSNAEACLKKMIRETIPNARFNIIPNNHPLYHCFFDFNDGPPNGSELGANGPFMSKQRYYLEGVWYKGRLVAVYSNKGYIVKWSEDSNNDPQLKMGVNMIIFALTQKGGIANITR